MDQGQSQPGEGMNHEPDDRTADDVRAGIEQTRAELGDTVEALAAKTDVKAQAQRAVHDARTTVSEKALGARQAMSGRSSDTLSAVQQAAPDSAADATRKVARMLDRNRARLIPVGALALGVIIGRRRAR